MFSSCCSDDGCSAAELLSNKMRSKSNQVLLLTGADGFFMKIHKNFNVDGFFIKIQPKKNKFRWIFTIRFDVILGNLRAIVDSYRNFRAIVFEDY